MPSSGARESSQIDYACPKPLSLRVQGVRRGRWRRASSDCYRCDMMVVDTEANSGALVNWPAVAGEGRGRRRIKWVVVDNNGLELFQESLGVMYAKGPQVRGKVLEKGQGTQSMNKAAYGGLSNVLNQPGP